MLQENYVKLDLHSSESEHSPIGHSSLKLTNKAFFHSCIVFSSY